MLILTRRSGESIIIGGKARVTVRTLRTYGCVIDVSGIAEPFRKSMSIGEALEIPECESEVQVLDRHGSQVRIGINAPKNVSIHREEVQLRIELERNGTKMHAANGRTESTAQRTA